METLGKALHLLGVRDSGNPNTGQGEGAFGAVVAGRSMAIWARMAAAIWPYAALSAS